MKTMGLLCACLAMACGGSKDEAKEPAPTASEPAPTAEPMTADTAGVGGQPTEATTPPAVATPEPEPVKATPVIATADLKSYSGDTSLGTLTFEVQEAGKIAISGQFSGLAPGPHALYLHENGDCGKKGKAAGGHFNPTKAKHGGLGSTDRHAGDFGDVVADDSGNGTFAVTTDSVTVDPGESPTSVVGKAAIIYARKDGKSGTAGAAVACGVITLPAEGSAPTDRK